jgi:hypothetical protein
MMTGRTCLDPTEDLSPGQAEEIDRVLAAYPHLTDDEFVLAKPMVTASTNPHCMAYCMARIRSSLFLKSPFPTSFMPRIPRPIAFIVFELRTPRPIIDFSAMSSRVLRYSITAAFFLSLGYLSVVFLITMFLQGIQGLSPLDAALLLIPGYAAVISGELEEELPDWKISIGPREAGHIPAYLKMWKPE